MSTPVPLILEGSVQATTKDGEPLYYWNSFQSLDSGKFRIRTDLRLLIDNGDDSGPAFEDVTRKVWGNPAIGWALCHTCDQHVIAGFHGQYSWLSNFHRAPVEYNSHRFPTSEHAYQCAKLPQNLCNTGSLYLAACQMTAGACKRWGQTIQMRPDWDSYKVEAMEQILLSKFTLNIGLKSMLINTGSKFLIETNFWGDNFWGHDLTNEKVGRNQLGISLMAVRQRLAFP